MFHQNYFETRHYIGLLFKVTETRCKTLDTTLYNNLSIPTRITVTFLNISLGNLQIYDHKNNSSLPCHNKCLDCLYSVESLCECLPDLR